MSETIYKKIYEEGQLIGSLIFLSRIPSEKKGDSPMGNFLCTCGKGFACRILSVKNLVTKSCGCKKSELNKAASTKHGHAPNSKRSPEYLSWQAMWARLTNPNQQNYDRYKKLNISICDEWKDFGCFLKDMGLKPSKTHTIDRKENTKGYYKQNCRWATKSEQARNKSNTTFVEYKGMNKSIAEWAEIIGLSLPTLYNRIKGKWDIERAFTHPSNGVYPKLIKSNKNV